MYGPHTAWDQDVFKLTGVDDIFQMLLSKSLQDPSMILGGISHTLVQSDISERIDHLLRVLEIQEAVLGNGTMLILGDSVLHSRFHLEDTRMVIFIL